ncbi:MAG: hypothetical protein ACI89X_003160 [Planctomycetota bacterium]|jgi:hypothetical protein
MIRAKLSRWLAASLSAVAVAMPQQDPAPKHLALVIGIDEYAQPDSGHGTIPHLRGAENDAARARALLLDRFGFAALDIVTLRGPQATHEAIVRTFYDHLICKADSDTKVVIWFSGHGSRVPDPSKADTSPRDRSDDPWDDTLLAYDSRKGERKGRHDVTDDELRSLLAALKATDVVFVTDCCHSGGLLRGGPELGVRHASHGTEPLDHDVRRKFWPQDVPFLDDDRGEVELPAVHIAACGATQEAGEYESGSRWHGTLTWFLTSALAEVPERTSWQAVTEMVRARIAASRLGTRPSQLVQCIGPGARAIFGGSGKPVPSGYATRRVDGKLRIEAGRIHGIVEGSELRVVGLNGAEHGTVRVDRARATFCEAVPLSRKLPVVVALRAVPERGLEGRAPMRIACKAEGDAALLRDCPWAIVTSIADADYVLVPGDAKHVLQAADGTFVRNVPSSREGARQALFHEHCFRSLWEGVAQPGRYRVGLTVQPFDSAEDPKRRPSAKVLTTGAQRALVGARHLPAEIGTGQWVQLTVTNHASQKLNVAVISIAEDRAVNVIWGRDNSNELGPDASKILEVELGPSETWSGKRSRPMIDRYIVIATRSYADFKLFESTAEIDVTRGNGNDEQRATGLPSFLNGALSGATTTTRGGGGGGKPPAWGIHWLDLELVLPERFEELTKKR